MNPKVVSPGGIFNVDGGGQSEAVRSGNWLETGSARTGLFRRTLELSFLPAPPFRAISDRRSTT